MASEGRGIIRAKTWGGHGSGFQTWSLGSPAEFEQHRAQRQGRTLGAEGDGGASVSG